MVGTPEMMNSVNVLILVDRRVTTENVSEQLGFLRVQYSKIFWILLFLKSVVVGFHQDNARPHITARIMEVIN